MTTMTSILVEPHGPSSRLVEFRTQQQFQCRPGPIPLLSGHLALLFQGLKAPIQQFSWKEVHQTQGFCHLLWWSSLATSIPFSFVGRQDSLQLVGLKNLSRRSPQATYPRQKTDLRAIDENWQIGKASHPKQENEAPATGIEYDPESWVCKTWINITSKNGYMMLYDKLYGWYTYIINATEGLILAISQWTHFSAFSLANTMACSHRAVTTLGPSAGCKKWCDNGSMLGMDIRFLVGLSCTSTDAEGYPQGKAIIHGFHGGFRSPTWGDHSSDGVYNLRWMIFRNKHLPSGNLT